LPQTLLNLLGPEHVHVGGGGRETQTRQTGGEVKPKHRRFGPCRFPYFEVRQIQMSSGRISFREVLVLESDAEEEEEEGAPADEGDDQDQGGDLRSSKFFAIL
jgi:hypothetical protein